MLADRDSRACHDAAFIPMRRPAPSGAGSLSCADFHQRQPFHDVVGKGGGFFGDHVHIERHVFGGGRQPAFLGVMQVLEIVHALMVEAKQLEGDAHRRIDQKLAQIANMDFGGEGRVLGGLDVAQTEAEQLVDLVHGAVEQHIIVGHVEMAVVIDPGGLDPHHRRHEGREERGFGVTAVEHGVAAIRFQAA